ncbi:hypothetical protein BGX38DRAFT_1218136 [Terfezia claveryi]|nr:hypothetical protein BGX38DRAFT_1218136 [Terfezia claveryi]
MLMQLQDFVSSTCHIGWVVNLLAARYCEACCVVVGIASCCCGFTVAVASRSCCCSWSLDDGTYLITGQVGSACPRPEKLSTCPQPGR